jgi:hypothetical protein
MVISVWENFFPDCSMTVVSAKQGVLIAARAETAVATMAVAKAIRMGLAFRSATICNDK